MHEPDIIRHDFANCSLNRHAAVRQGHRILINPQGAAPISGETPVVPLKL